MSAIFISHSSRDTRTADLVVDWLLNLGHRSVFLDFDPELGIPPGRNWEQELYRQIRLCRAVVVICSRSSMASRWCFMEITHARALGKHLFPVRIDDCDIDPVLADQQVIDLSSGQLASLARLERGLVAAGLDPADSFDWDGSRSPYPGLLAFQEDDAATFFGRDREIGDGLDILERVRRFGAPSLVMVFGASGTGKSSLVRAGILPRLKRQDERWLVVEPFRPRDDPLQGLAASLSRAYEDHGGGPSRLEIVELLRESVPPETSVDGAQTGNALRQLAGDLRLAARREDARVLVTIDQFEELLDRSTEHRSDELLALIGGSIESDDSALAFLGTMRSDFLGLFQRSPALQEIDSLSLSLGPMAVGDIAQVIAKPAELAGLDLEEGLVEQMTFDAETDDALPLVAFALRELYERYGGDGQITLANYEEGLGGLQGAMAAVADELIASQQLSPEREGDLRLAFLAMVRIGADGAYLRAAANRDALPTASDDLLERFVQSRLLVASGDLEQRTIEVAHEALFRSWGTLRGWLYDAAAALALRDDLVRAATRWAEADRSEDHLWLGGRLEVARELVDRGEIPVDAVALAFLTEGERVRRLTAKAEALRRRRVISASVTLAVLLTSIAVAVAVWTSQRNRELDERNRALQITAIEALIHSGTEALAKPGAGDLVAVQSATDGVLLYNSLSDPPLELGHRLQFNLSQILGGATLRNELPGLGDRVIGLWVTPDGRMIAGVDQVGRIAVWRSDGLPITDFSIGPSLFVHGAAFSPDHKTVAILVAPLEAGGNIGSSRRLQIWDLDETRLAVFDVEDTAIDVSLKCADPVFEILHRDGESELLALDGRDGAQCVEPLGERPSDDLLTAGGLSLVSDGSLLHVSQSGFPGRELTVETNHGWIDSLSASGHGDLIATGGRDGIVRLWNFSTVFSTPLQRGRWGEVSRARLVDSSLIAVDRKGNVHIDADFLSSQDTQVVELGNGVSRRLAVSPNGRLIAYELASVIVIHDPVSGRSTELEIEGSPLEFGFTADDRLWLAVSEGADVVQIFDSDGNALGRWRSPETEFDSVAVHPKLDRIVGMEAGGVPVLLQASESEVSAVQLIGHSGPVDQVIFSGSGENIATASRDGSVALWTADGRELHTFPVFPNGPAIAALSPDGLQLAAGDLDGVVRVWSTQTFQQLAEYQTDRGQMFDLSFSADGSWLVAVPNDLRVRVWPNETLADLVQAVCTHYDDWLVSTSGADASPCKDP